jgi:hypothetical protein
MKATDKIKSIFSNIFYIEDWIYELENCLSWRGDLINNHWFLATILSQPSWNDYFVFTCAVEMLIKKNPDLVEDKKFNEIVQDNSPDSTPSSQESEDLEKELISEFNQEQKSRIYAKIEKLNNHKSLVIPNEKIPF